MPHKAEFQRGSIYLSKEDMLSLNDEFIPKYTKFKIVHLLKKLVVLKTKDLKQVYVHRKKFYANFMSPVHIEFEL